MRCGDDLDPEFAVPMATNTDTKHRQVAPQPKSKQTCQVLFELHDHLPCTMCIL
jgi:hypothetical protein